MRALTKKEKRAILARLDKRGDISPGVIFTLIIAVALGVMFLAAMFPPAFDAFYGADTGNWTVNGAEDTKTTTVWYMIPMIAGMCGVIVFVGVIYKLIT